MAKTQFLDYNIREHFVCFCFTMRKCSQSKFKMGAKRPKSAVLNKHPLVLIYNIGWRTVLDKILRCQQHLLFTIVKYSFILHRKLRNKFTVNCVYIDTCLGCWGAPPIPEKVLVLRSCFLCQHSKYQIFTCIHY